MNVIGTLRNGRLSIVSGGLLGFSLLFSAPSYGARVVKNPTQEYLGWTAGSVYNVYYSSPEEACQSPGFYTNPEKKFLRSIPADGRENVRKCLFDYIDKPYILGPEWGGTYVRMAWAQACDQGTKWDKNLRVCILELPKPGFCEATPKPILLSSGKKYLQELIYRGSGPFPLEFSLHYDSEERSPSVAQFGAVTHTGLVSTERDPAMDLVCRPDYGNGGSANPAKSSCAPPRIVGGKIASPAVAPGIGWRHRAQRGVSAIGAGKTAVVTRPDNSAFSYSLVDGVWTGEAAAKGKLARIVDSAQQVTGWTYTTADNDVESYDAAGRLQSITARGGLKHTYAYDELSRLTSITDLVGRKLTFTFDAHDRVLTMTDPAQQITTFGYDANNNLSTITFGDGSAKTFLYEDQRFPHAMTGTIDENGVRTMTYSYDTKGRAYDEIGPGGVNHYSLVFDTYSTVETDPLNSQRTVTFKEIAGMRKVVSRSQPGGAGCTASSSATTYDINGNLETQTNFNNVTTSYVFDPVRNLETSRTEAKGKPEARTITTAWHNTLRIEAKIAEPRRLTTFTHDASGNVLTKTEQATTDLNGSLGFAATLTGVPRTWTYTYNAMGQVLTVRGPRTDVVDITTYTYDERGDLRSVKNAAQQETRLGDYDANGRVGTITEPNNVVTSMAYWPRGWLKSRSVTAGGVTETTSYGYDDAGQLTTVTLPDASTVSYTYDGAHRLTGIADSLGNTITYTLDNMGNRIGEQVKNPAGDLVRQTTRIMDALNRVQQITGAK